MLIDMKYKLAPACVETIEITVHMDGCSAHVSLVEDASLKHQKICCYIKNKTSGSKNYLSLIDSRIAKVSKILNQEMQSDHITKKEVARNTAYRYNNIPGTEGLRPSELYFGRNAITGKNINVDINKLRTAIVLFRKATRESKEKINKNCRHRQPKVFVPYKPGMEYGKSDVSPIKVGDQLLIDRGGFDKNDLSPWFEVVTNENYPTGLNFDEKLVLTKKVGRNSKFKVWQMDWILEVVPGEYKNDSGKYLALILSNFDEDMNLLPWADGPYDIQGDPYLNNEFCKIQNIPCVMGPVYTGMKEVDNKVNDSTTLDLDNKATTKTCDLNDQSNNSSFDIVSENSSFEVISNSSSFGEPETVIEIDEPMTVTDNHEILLSDDDLDIF